MPTLPSTQRTFGKARASASTAQHSRRKSAPASALPAPQQKNQSALWHAVAFLALMLVCAGAALQWYMSRVLDKSVVAVGAIAALLAMHQFAKALGWQFRKRRDSSASSDGDWFGISDTDGGGSDGGGDGGD